MMVNVERLVHSLKCLGGEFQGVGAAMEKALSPQIQHLFLRGGETRVVSEKLRLQDEV